MEVVLPQKVKNKKYKAPFGSWVSTHAFDSATMFSQKKFKFKKFPLTKFECRTKTSSLNPESN